MIGMYEDVQPFHKGDYEKHYTPSAVVYIREKNQLEDYDEAAFREKANDFEDNNEASPLKEVTLTDDLKNEIDDIKQSESNVYLEHPYSLLKENENWRNKLEKDDSLFNKTMKISPVAVAVKKASRKRKTNDIVQRKPTKFFKECRDIHVRQTDVALGNNTKKKTSIKVLKNGSKSSSPIILNNQKLT